MGNSEGRLGSLSLIELRPCRRGERFVRETLDESSFGNDQEDGNYNEDAWS